MLLDVQCPTRRHSTTLVRWNHFEDFGQRDMVRESVTFQGLQAKPEEWSVTSRKESIV